MEVQDGLVVPEVGVENPVEPVDEEVELAMEPPAEPTVADALNARIDLATEDAAHELNALKEELAFTKQTVYLACDAITNLQNIVSDLVARIADHNLRSSHKI